jgi:hypothetical protein
VTDAAAHGGLETWLDFYGKVEPFVFDGRENGVDESLDLVIIRSLVQNRNSRGRKLRSKHFFDGRLDAMNGLRRFSG